MFRPGGRTILCRKMCSDKIERIGDYVLENIVLAIRRCAFFFLISGFFPINHVFCSLLEQLHPRGPDN